MGSATVVFLNEDLNDIMKIVKPLEDAVLSIESVNKTIESEVNEQKREFLCILAGTLCASLSGNMLSGKGVVKDGDC